MITCCLRYVVDPYKPKEFGHYAKLWMPLVQHFGGTHHGYFLPSEGTNNIALAMFSFTSLAEYEQYREHSAVHPEVIAVRKFSEETRCFLSYERTFFKPLLPGAPSG